VRRVRKESKQPRAVNGKEEGKKSFRRLGRKSLRVDIELKKCTHGRRKNRTAASEKTSEPQKRKKAAARKQHCRNETGDGEEGKASGLAGTGNRRKIHEREKKRIEAKTNLVRDGGT